MAKNEHLIQRYPDLENRATYVAKRFEQVLRGEPFVEYGKFQFIRPLGLRQAGLVMAQVKIGKAQKDLLCSYRFWRKWPGIAVLALI
ncbi:MAG: hypothetical protein HC880_09490 [Bacteroidia bacterium]|nr:hypothetical protein [Bacteroidia bacterium]